MPILNLDTAARKPPPTSADQLGRDVNRWVWDNLCFALPILEAGLIGWRDVITGVHPTATGTITSGRDERGQVVATQAGGANYLSYGNQPAHVRPSNAITGYVRFRYNGTSATNYGLYGKVHTDGSQLSWGVYATDATGNLNGYLTTSAGAGNTNLSGSGALPTGVWLNIFFRWQSGEIFTVDCLKDGGALAATNQAASSGTLSGTITYTSEPFRVWAVDNPNGLGGDMSVVSIWARKLTDAEIRTIAADPWLAFRRPRLGHQRIYLGPSIIGEAGAVLLTASSDDMGQVTEITVETPPEQGSTLHITKDGTPTDVVVPADTVHTEVIDAADDVTDIGVESEPS